MTSFIIPRTIPAITGTQKSIEPILAIGTIRLRTTRPG